MSAQVAFEQLCSLGIDMQYQLNVFEMVKKGPLSYVYTCAALLKMETGQSKVKNGVLSRQKIAFQHHS